MTTPEAFDLIVLGGGNALAVASAAARAGQRVAVVEPRDLGGTCPNRGCIPSKRLIRHAHAVDAVRAADRFHVRASLEGVDAKAVFQAMRRYVTAVPGGVRDGLPDTVEVIEAAGRFVGERIVEAGGRQITAPTIIVGVGSRPRLVPGLDRDDVPYWTSDDVFEQEDVPSSLLIVGGGVIGCELQHVFHALGTRTMLVHRGPALLETEDEDVQRVFRQGVDAAGLDVRTSTQVTAVQHDGETFHVTLEGPDGRPSSVACRRLLYAIGRGSNADALDAAASGVDVDAHGFVSVDGSLQTTCEGVYALGDVVGNPMLTHKASTQARYLIRRLVHGERGPLDMPPIPAAAFTAPEVASVGRTEGQLRDAGTPYRMAKLSYEGAAMGKALKEPHGLVKLLAAPDGEILGCHVVGHEAHVLVHLASMAMAWGRGVRDLAEMVHIHPGLTELLRNAARKLAAA